VVDAKLDFVSVFRQRRRAGHNAGIGDEDVEAVGHEAFEGFLNRRTGAEVAFEECDFG
jgi:hypothetical protein